MTKSALTRVLPQAAMAIPGSLFPPIAPFNLPVVFGLNGEITFRATPEPTSLALFGLAAPLVLRRRRKA